MKFIIGIWMVLFCLAGADGQAPSILMGDEGSVRVVGLKLKNQVVGTIDESEWKVILPVYTQEAWNKKINQPIGGVWFVEGDDIIFKPHFPFSPGETYHASFDGYAFAKHISKKNAFIKETLELTFSLPKLETTHSSIDAVYPTSKVVPENMLRMYICFSSPMMPGEAYEHIRLLREDGSVVEKPFLVIDQELWDAERKRFTLLFDPGRIKRTLKSNLELGAPLKQGMTYRLVIDSTWRNINGNLLESSFAKEFTIASAQRIKLSKEAVSVVSPKADSRSEVILSFDRQMDRVLMSKYVSVTNLSTGEVAGTGRMVDDLTWAFTPDQLWTDGQYEISISPWAEDVCGNNFNNAFDLDLKKEKRISTDETIRFSFTVKSVDQ